MLPLLRNRAEAKILLSYDCAYSKVKIRPALWGFRQS